MRHDSPAAPAVRDLLGRILSSETFKRSERARSLLAYLVEREQAGEAERLKGYAIAVDVFGRNEEFDASTDALVRVQAGRLRELLAHYYATEGVGDATRIVVPRGGYVPSYEIVAPFSSEVARPGQVAPTGGSRIRSSIAALFPMGSTAGPKAEKPVGIGHVRVLWGALMSVLVLLLVITYRTHVMEMARGGAAIATESSAEARVVDPALMEKLPRIYVLADGSNQAVARVTALFRTAFASFDTVDLISSRYSKDDRRPPYDPTGFVLSVAAGSADGVVLLELQSLRSGQVLLNRALPASITSSEALVDKVASLATTIAPATGMIYGYLREKGLQQGLVACLALTDSYFVDQTKENHRAAYRCFEKLADAGSKSPLVYAELASLHIEAVTDGYAYPPRPSEEQAMTFARQALQFGPTSQYVHRAMGFLYSCKGDHSESILWMRKAYELNTFDLSMAASFGYALVFAGEYQQGAAVLQRAVDATSAHPTWWDYYLFLARFMLGDMDAASRATDALLVSNKSHYLAARLIVAHARGDEQRADALASELVGSYPKFAADPGRVLRNANYPTDLTSKFVDALKVAGIGGAI